MISNDKWRVKNGCLYSPRDFMYKFLFIWGVSIFICTALALNKLINAGFYLPGLVIAFVIYLAPMAFQFKRFGPDGVPIAEVTDTKISVTRWVGFASAKKDTYDLYEDDVVHVVGVENNRFIRLKRKNGNDVREIRNYADYSAKSRQITAFLAQSLEKNHQVIHEDYPSFMSSIRGDY